MVNFQPEHIVESTLAVGAIYRLHAPDVIGTEIPHYFIVVAILENNNYLVMCTSQGGNKERYFERNKIDLKGLVHIKPDSQNGLTKDTYVNCNDVYPLTKRDLINRARENKLSPTGKLSLNHYWQIKEGILSNRLNDIPKKLLIHPDE